MQNLHFHHPWRLDRDIRDVGTKGLSRIYLLAAVFAVASFSASAGTGCNTNAKKRVVVGQQPTANALYEHLRHVDLGAWDDGFAKEMFTYVGDVHTKAGKTFKLGILETVWGLSCRATNRFFIFDAENNVLGQYYGLMIDDPKKIVVTGATVVFPFDPKYGNSLDLENGPPPKAWLDGDNPDWEPAQPKSAPPPPDPGTAPPPPK